MTGTLLLERPGVVVAPLNGACDCAIVKLLVELPVKLPVELSVELPVELVLESDLHKYLVSILKLAS